MKNKFFLAAMILGGLVIMTACNPENANEQLGIPEGGLMLSVEKYSDHNNTKTSVQDNSVQWVGDGSESVRLNGSPYIVNISGGKAYVNASELADVATIRGYYAFNTIADEGTNTPTVEIPATYVSSMVGDRQVIALPMVAYRTTKDNAIQFKHVTAAVKVLVWNATASTLFVDRVVIKTDTYRINGSLTLNLTAENYGIITDNSSVPTANREVVVTFATPMEIESGESNAKSIQVPIMPIGADNITIEVYGHNSDISGVPINGLTHIFSHKTTSTSLERNVMLTARVKMDPSSSRVVSKGIFSVSPTKAIYFSKGNLICHRFVDTWAPNTCVWSFLNNQYQICEKTGQIVGTDYVNYDTVSLFGWGTSNLFSVDGFCTTPYSTTGTLQYGPNNVGSYTLTGVHDWGYNAITNGGNTQNSGWRTPSKEEWGYLLDGGSMGCRTTNTNNLPNGRGDNQHARFTMATIAGKYKGLIIFPDTYSHPTNVSLENAVYNEYSVFSATIATISEWEQMETAGAIFLPASGRRLNDEIYQNWIQGAYWSSFTWAGYQASVPCLIFNSAACGSGGEFGRYEGLSVRLIRDAN